MIASSVASLIKNKVVFELESIDRLYLNGYVPQLQTPAALAGFIRNHLGLPIASTAAVAPISRRLVAAIERLALEQAIPM
ncbi:MAG: hypothetical protein AB1781_11455, partial [Pseudomonadota bacterium]